MVLILISSLLWTRAALNTLLSLSDPKPTARSYVAGRKVILESISIVDRSLHSIAHAVLVIVVKIEDCRFGSTHVSRSIVNDQRPVDILMPRNSQIDNHALTVNLCYPHRNSSREHLTSSYERDARKRFVYVELCQEITVTQWQLLMLAQNPIKSAAKCLLQSIPVFVLLS